MKCLRWAVVLAPFTLPGAFCPPTPPAQPRLTAVRLMGARVCGSFSTPGMQHSFACDSLPTTVQGAVFSHSHAAECQPAARRAWTATTRALSIEPSHPEGQYLWRRHSHRREAPRREDRHARLAAGPGTRTNPARGRPVEPDLRSASHRAHEASRLALQPQERRVLGTHQQHELRVASQTGGSQARIATESTQLMSGFGSSTTKTRSP